MTSKSEKSSGLGRSAFARGLSVSLAGIRAGGNVAADNVLRKLNPFASKDPSAASAVLRKESERFVAELGRQKGSYVKIGQLLAQFGEHFLPQELTESLHQLESKTEALPWAYISGHVKSSLGTQYELLDIEHSPIAAASLAQVHIARVKKTREVLCLKILYPGLRETIDKDFDNVVRMLTLARFLTATDQLDVWLEAMRKQLHRETDYGNEAAMLEKMTGLLREEEKNQGLLHYKLPYLAPQFSRNDVLAMEYVEGVAAYDPSIQSLSLARRNKLAKAMLELFFLEVFEWGLVQTDPNFGNYLIQQSPNLRGLDAQSDKLVLLDFGAVEQCSEIFVSHLRATIVAGLEQDRDLLAASLQGLGCLVEDSSDEARRSFSDFCITILEPLRPVSELPSEHLNSKGQYQWAQSMLIKRAGKFAAKASMNQHFSVPGSEFTLIARKLIGVFTFISVLSAEFNGYEIASKHTTKWRATQLKHS